MMKRQGDLLFQRVGDRPGGREFPVEDGVIARGEDAIRDMHARYLAAMKGKPLPAPDEPSGSAPAVEPYVADESLPRAVMVDIDGTLALHGARSPFDETRVREDRPNAPVVATVHALWRAEYRIVLCSGRTEGCRDATEAWLREHLGVDSGTARFPIHDTLHMRAVGDTRKAAIVKREVFDREIRHRCNVVLVLDDRDQVVEAYREMGLTVFQVAPGAF